MQIILKKKFIAYLCMHKQYLNISGVWKALDVVLNFPYLPA